MEERRQIKVYEIVGGNSAITDTDGRKVFDKIDALLSEGLKVDIDFVNIDIIITVFLNASIGQLYKKYTSEELTENLKIINVNKSENIHFQEVIDYAKRFFDNPAGEEKSEQEIKNTMGYE